MSAEKHTPIESLLCRIGYALGDFAYDVKDIVRTNADVRAALLRLTCASLFLSGFALTAICNLKVEEPVGGESAVAASPKELTAKNIDKIRETLTDVERVWQEQGAIRGSLRRVKSTSSANRAIAYKEDDDCKAQVGQARSEGLVICDRFSEEDNLSNTQYSNTRWQIFPFTPQPDGSREKMAFACAPNNNACQAQFTLAIAEAYGARPIEGLKDFTCALLVDNPARPDHLAIGPDGITVHAYSVGIGCVQINKGALAN